MNNVHEPGSRTMFKKFDLGKVSSQTGSKQAECTKCIAHWPSCTPRLRPGRAPRAPSASAPHSPAALARLLTPLPRACSASACHARPARPSACAPLPPACPACACCAPGRVAAPSACPFCIATEAYPKLTIQFVLQYKPAAHQIVLQYSFFSSQDASIAIDLTLLQYNFNPLLCNKNQCIAIHFQPILGASLQYNFMYCNTISILLKSSSLQYNDCIAIQFPFLLQYNWAVAHSNFCTNLFFVFHYIIYFFSIISSSWKNH